MNAFISHNGHDEYVLTFKTMMNHFVEIDVVKHHENQNVEWRNLTKMTLIWMSLTWNDTKHKSKQTKT